MNLLTRTRKQAPVQVWKCLIDKIPLPGLKPRSKVLTAKSLGAHEYCLEQIMSPLKASLGAIPHENGVTAPHLQGYS